MNPATLEEIAYRALERAEELRIAHNEGGYSKGYYVSELALLIQDLISVNRLVKPNENRDR